MPRGLHCLILQTLQLHVSHSLSLRRETYFYLDNYDYIRSFPSPFTVNVILKPYNSILSHLQISCNRYLNLCPANVILYLNLFYREF